MAILGRRDAGCYFCPLPRCLSARSLTVAARLGGVETNPAPCDIFAVLTRHRREPSLTIGGRRDKLGDIRVRSLARCGAREKLGTSESVVEV